MAKFFRLAWRDLWRNKRRSLLTIAAIAFAILMVAVTRSLQYGVYDTMESLAVRLYNGEIQIHRRGFQAEQTLTYFLRENERDWQALLQAHPELTACARRLTSFGLVSSDSASTGALIVGIEPGRESRITQFTTMVRRGSRLQPDDDHRVLVGMTLARNLQVDLGDTLIVLTQGYRNQMGADSYVVKGLVSIGQADLDRALMVMRLKDAQELFSLEGGITQVVCRTHNFRKATGVSHRLSRDLGERSYEVLSWEQMMPELKQIILVDNVSGAIYLAFLLIVVGFEIFNTTMMSVIERTREFGVLQAIGVKPRQVSGLILWESCLKILVALVVGLILTGIVISILERHPIPLSDELREAYSSYGFALDDLRFSGKLRVYLEPVISITIVALSAIIFPLYKTARLTPVEAFRKT